MKYLKLSKVLMITATFLLISCDKNDDTSTDNYDCTFVQNDEAKDGLIDENEKQIMLDCIDSAIESKTQLEENIIGAWELVGFGHGWIGSISQPCSLLEFEEDGTLTLQYTNQYIDTTTMHTWEIVSNPDRFTLQITPQPVEYIFISYVCPNYMFGNGTFSDGNMHLYEKMN